MQKIVIHRPGGFNSLKIESFPDPVASDDEIVVEVKAIGVNYADCVIRMGFYASAKEYIGWPITPGFDFSGIVHQAGKNISNFKPGDRVFGVSLFNAYATHVVVPAHQLFHIPEKRSFEEAGTFSTIIDKSSQNLWSEVEKIAPDGLDAVLDGNGYITLRDGLKHLRANGKLIAYGFHSMFPRKHGFPNLLKLAIDYFRTPRFNPLGMHDKNYSLVTFNLSFLFNRTDLLKIAMDDLVAWFTEGKISLPPITTYPFTNSAQAHRDLQSGTTVGKLVLVT
jgi:NADPH:quinone reductase-like Zn-dependent oxidoreductase